MITSADMLYSLLHEKELTKNVSICNQLVNTTYDYSVYINNLNSHHLCIFFKSVCTHSIASDGVIRG